MQPARELTMLPPLAEIFRLLRTHSDPPPDLGGPFSSTHTAALAALALGDRLLAYGSGHHEKLALEEAQAQLRTHYNAYRSLFSPIRKLPVEILLEIFAIATRSLPPITAPPRRRIRNTLATTPIEPMRLEPLRPLSLVCALWRSIFDSSPALWSRICIAGPFETTTSEIPFRATLLCLERARKAPLEIYIQDASRRGIGLFTNRVLQWQNVHISGLKSIEDLEYLGEIVDTHGLPSLSKLRLASFLPSDELPAKCLAFISRADHLGQLSVTGNLTLHVPAEVLQRIDTLTCTANPSTVEDAISVMDRLPRDVAYNLVFYCDFRHRWDAPIDLHVLPTPCGVTHLSLQIGNFDRAQASTVVKTILEAVTLPNLVDLRLGSAGSSPGTFTSYYAALDDDDLDGPKQGHLPFPWFHAEFLELSHRSSFSAHLLKLDLVDVHISVDHLVECLSLLGVLETLSIGEHPIQPYPHRLITNALLRALTSTSTLVPRLKLITMATILAFDDRVLLSFLHSRVNTNSTRTNPSDPFECHVRAIPGYWRRLGNVDSTAHVVGEVAILRKESGLRLSWTELSGRNIRLENQEEYEDDEYFSGDFELEN
ncbi:hypothetical protein C8F01DRAFT_1376861 [Mycena amicta]|nr:hypothetical protein C8F01DRAFT_1376861 [Mycena amicta]